MHESKILSASESLIGDHQQLPEITVKAVILGVLLAIILTASNAYLGLKVGLTISASIPAAVISMGILRFFRRSNVLENNIVQTAASAGEAVVGGIAYVLPAMIILHLWDNFKYWETVTITIIGGLLGVLLSVPLRRVLLADKQLVFPEGLAIGNVLKASVAGGAALKYLVQGGLIGSVISLAQSGFKLLADNFSIWFESKGVVWGVGLGFSPALIAAGYIVGIGAGFSILLGVILGWILGVPILTYLNGTAIALNPTTVAMTLWHDQIRYIGVGVMLVGGLWTLVHLLRPIIDGLRSSFASVQALREGGHAAIARTNRDIPITYVLWGIAVLSIPLIFLLLHFMDLTVLNPAISQLIFLLSIMWLFIIFASFIFASICGYFAGLVGTTNSPISAMTLAALVLGSLLLAGLFSAQGHDLHDAAQAMSVASIAIIMTSIIAAAAVITNDNIQDLKAGQMIGATPWKQQVMLMVGAVSAALVLPLILQILFNAYGISGVFPRSGMDPTQMLAAPQAGAMAVVVQSVFSHQLPWGLLGTGAAIAIIVLLLDKVLTQRYGMRLHVLGIGMGIYLPIDTTVPLIFGALISFLVTRQLKRQLQRHPKDENKVERANQAGLILACGLVAGATLMGVILAIPFAIAKSTDVMRLVSVDFQLFAQILSMIVTVGLGVWLYRIPCHKNN